MRTIFTCILLAILGCRKSPSSPDTIVLYAASSLKECVTEIAREWSRRTGRPYRLQFEATSTLGRQIHEGAPAHLFLPAASEWLDPIPTLDRYDWLSNRLVVVVSLHEPEMDLGAITSLALTNEHVPSGKYARQTLSNMGWRIPDRVLYGHNVRDVLSKVSHGGAQAGIVYATDAAIDPNVRVAYTFPQESHDRILYSVALLQVDGRSFFDALQTSWAVEIAQGHGFLTWNRSDSLLR